MENICNDSCTKVRIGIILIYVSQNICPEASGGTSHYNLILLLQFNIQTTEYFINGIQIVFVQIIWKNRSVVACFPVSFCFQWKLITDSCINGTKRKEHLAQFYRILFGVTDCLVDGFQNPISILTISTKQSALKVVKILNANQRADSTRGISVSKYIYTVNAVSGG